MICSLQSILRLDTRPTELFIGTTAAVWGFFVVLPFDTFNSVSLAYQSMQALAPEGVWGLMMCVLGAAQVICLQRSAYPWLARWHRTISLALVFMLALIASCFWISIPLSTGGIIYSMIALPQAWVTIRINHDGRANNRRRT